MARLSRTQRIAKAKKEANLKYNQSCEDVFELLSEITNLIEASWEKIGEDANYADVGTMNHYRHQLQDIHNSLAKTGEYAD